MKKLILLSILLLLTACGGPEQEDAIKAPASPSPSVWGIVVDTTPTPAQTLAPTPSPTPSPTLQEVTPAGPQVRLQYADAETRFLSAEESPYLTVESVLIDGSTYVRLSDLTSVYPWLQPQAGGVLTFSTIYGTTVSPLPEKTIFSGIEPAGLDLAPVAEDPTTWVPLRAVARQTGLYVLWDEEWNVVYVSQLLNMTHIPQGRSVPTLMYHEVGDDPWGIPELFVTTENMKAQLQYLYDHGYDPIFFSDLTHLSDYDKPVLLTFDDGYEGNYTELFPLLQAYQMKATIFVIPDLIDTEYYLTGAQIREMADSGLVSIQSHTQSHRMLDTLSYEEQQQEMLQSQLAISRITGRIPYVLCYPTGKFDENTLTLGPNYYHFGLKSKGGMWVIDQEYFQVDRYYVARATSLSVFAGYLN